jgi:hypothetical protein
VRRRIATALLLGELLFAALGFQPARAAAIAPGHDDYPRLGMYSAIRGNGAPFLRANGSLDTLVCREQARWDLVILDAAAPSRRPDILAALRRYNPGIRVYAYVMGAIYWANPHPALGDTTTDFPWRYWAAVRNTDGILWCRGGRPCGFTNVNVAKPVTMATLAILIAGDITRSGLWDGLFIDVTCPKIHGIVAGEDTVDLARLGFASVAAFEEAWTRSHRGFLEALRGLSPPGFPIVGNCGPGGEPLFNGWMRENFPWQNAGPGDDPWRANMIRNFYGAPGYLTDAERYMPPAASWLTWEPAGGDSTSPENLRRARYTNASATLGEGYASVARHEWERRRFWWAPENAVNQYGRATTNRYWRGWLGAPLGPAYAVDGAWRRDFRRGVVLVNPTNSPIRIRLGGAYRRIRAALPGYDGRRDTAFTLPARDGLFLLKAK